MADSDSVQVGEEVDTGVYIGVDPVYQNYANPGEAPYQTQEGPEAEAEKRAIDTQREMQSRNTVQDDHRIFPTPVALAESKEEPKARAEASKEEVPASAPAPGSPRAEAPAPEPGSPKSVPSN